MPGIAQYRIDGLVSGNGKGFWSNRTDVVTFVQLQKFWSELPPQARQKLLRIDKQTLFEQARKNMYCSRCNGLLLEGFLQIVMYGKSLQQDGAASQQLCNGLGTLKNRNGNNFCAGNGCQNDVQDPSVHPWGGLTATRDGMLSLLDCYLFSNSLKGLQNVFDSARARERERELLYPDACGGGGRGWISQGISGYGRGHGTRETCALHTARLSVDTLIDFWSALGEETRQSLLRMKEDDFIERLMYRFDSKRFCRDCRRNVIREFKELKELKRMRKEPRCSSWFCVADMAFQYEVKQDSVQADWHRTFGDTFGVYHHFEWAVGTGEGKSDILDFENVGLSGKVQVTGLDLSGLNACYITLRAWKMDGRCTEISVKAHALKGQQCVHCRLGVGDGFVTITRGESIRRFFEHAEEAEEEEDDDAIDKDGNDLDGECSRPQKHAKSPELAREFLLDAATVIFKEQVEKAFREGTARQNAHSIFVCLSLKLLEERIHVSCKEIITLEKQMKLLEEEEKEKVEEEERKERRRNKEREKKLRRKERLRGKDKDKKGSESNQHSLVSETFKEESTPCADEQSNDISDGDGPRICIASTPSSPDIEEEQLSDEFIYSNMQDHSDDNPDLVYAYTKDDHDSVATDKLQYSRQKLKFQKDSNMKWHDRRQYTFISETGNRMGKHEQRHHVDISEISRHVNGTNKLIRNDVLNSNTRNAGLKFAEKFHCSNLRTSDRHDFNPRSCNQQSEYRVKLDTQVAKVRESKYVGKPESAVDMSKPFYRGSKNNHVEYVRDSIGRLKSKSINSYNPSNRDTISTRRVWEPTESHKKYPRSNSDSDFTLKSSFKDEANEYDQHKSSSNADRSEEVSGDLRIGCDTVIRENRSDLSAARHECTQEVTKEESELCSTRRSSCGTPDSSVSSSSNSDNCSSCLSDSNASLTNSGNIESSSTSDSDDSSQNSEGRESFSHLQNADSSCQETLDKNRPSAEKEEHPYKNQVQDSEGPICSGVPATMPPNLDGRVNVDGGAQSQILLPPSHNQSVPFPIFHPPTVGFYHQSPISWPATPANGFMHFPHPSHYIFPSPYGYGLNGNTQVMQYGTLQHLTPPLLNPLPVFQLVAHQAYGINSRENQKIASADGVKEAHFHDATLTKVVSSGEHPEGARESMENGHNGKLSAEDRGFSLFHFGGPVALSTGFKSSPVSLKGRTTSDLSPSTDLNETDHVGNPKNCGEEYNLFAASNGIKFSF